MTGTVGIRAFLKNYWNYYIALENELLATERFLAFDPRNDHSFSLEYLKLYLAVCSEIDVLCKSLIKQCSLNFERESIHHYCKAITEHFPEFTSRKVTDFNNNRTFEPWSGWTCNIRSNCVDGNSPSWWKDYNTLKHERVRQPCEISTVSANYYLANQKNLLNAFAALYQLELYLFKEIYALDPDNNIDTPTPGSQMFIIWDWGNQFAALNPRLTSFRIDSTNQP